MHLNATDAAAASPHKLQCLLPLASTTFVGKDQAHRKQPYPCKDYTLTIPSKPLARIHGLARQRNSVSACLQVAAWPQERLICESFSFHVYVIVIVQRTSQHQCHLQRQHGTHAERKKERESDTERKKKREREGETERLGGDVSPYTFRAICFPNANLFA